MQDRVYILLLKLSKFIMYFFSFELKLKRIKTLDPLLVRVYGFYTSPWGQDKCIHPLPNGSWCMNCPDPAGWCKTHTPLQQGLQVIYLCYSRGRSRISQRGCGPVLRVIDLQCGHFLVKMRKQKNWVPWGGGRAPENFVCRSANVQNR